MPEKPPYLHDVRVIGPRLVDAVMPQQVRGRLRLDLEPDGLRAKVLEFYRVADDQARRVIETWAQPARRDAHVDDWPQRREPWDD